MERLIEEMATQTAVERREMRRNKAFKGATISYNRGFCALQCVVRDWSERGARLAFGDTTGITLSFEIQLAGSVQRRRAHVRWRAPERLGVSFD